MTYPLAFPVLPVPFDPDEAARWYIRTHPDEAAQMLADFIAGRSAALAAGLPCCRCAAPSLGFRRGPSSHRPVLRQEGT